MQSYEKLELEFAKWNSLPVEGMVVCSSGTAALHLAFEVFPIRQRDYPRKDVIVPQFTFIACARAVSMAGLNPVFIDCNDDLLCNYADHVDHAAAVLAVHVYGRQVNVDRIHSRLFALGGIATYVVEDLAEAHGLHPHKDTDAACWCLPGDVRVVNQNGKRIRMDRLGVGDQIWSLNQKTLKRELTTVTAKRTTPSQGALVKIGFESGESITASPNHKILVIREGCPVWLPTSEVKLKDSILHYRELTSMGDQSDCPDEKACYLAGLVASDGSVAQNNVVCFSNRDEGLKRIWKERVYDRFQITPSEFDPRNDTSRFCSKPIWNLMKSIRREVEGYTEDCIAAFVRGFADGDGCIFQKSNGKPAINLATFGKGEPRHFRHLLLRLGIRSQYGVHQPGEQTFPNGIKSQTKGGKCVVITNPESVERYLDIVGFSHPVKLAKSLKWKGKGNVATDRRDHLDNLDVTGVLKAERTKVGVSSNGLKSLLCSTISLAERGKVRITRRSAKDVAEELDSDVLRTLADSDVYFWRVTSVDILEDSEPLYDISVSNNSCFFANGVVVHNSFYKNKIIHGEEGGAVWFKNPEHAKLARLLRSHGSNDGSWIHIPRANNYRLSNCHADLILDSLAKADGNLSRRRQVEQWYDDCCPKEWRMLEREIPWLYDTRIKGINTESVVRRLNESKIVARLGFKPMQIQPEYSSFKYDPPCDLKAMKASQEIVCLPIHPTMDQGSANYNMTSLIQAVEDSK